MSKFMAGFGDGFTETQIMSETNSVKYKLSVTGSNSSSIPNNPGIYLNGKNLTTISHGSGINVWEIDIQNPSLPAVISRKTFELSTQDSNSNNTAFILYMDMLNPSYLYILTTNGILKSSPSVDAMMKAKGSINWPESNIVNMYNASYCGVFIPKFNKIVLENRTYTDGKPYNSEASVETVFDTIADIGSTGFPYRAVFDTNEYISTTDTVHRYPNSNFINPLRDFLIKPNDDMSISFDLYSSRALAATGKAVQLEVRWFNGSNQVANKVFSMSVVLAGTWVHFERFIKVPADVDGFTVVCIRTNPNTLSTEEAGVRNMVMCQVSRGETGLIAPTAIGVNGIRMTKATDDNVTDKLLILPDAADDPLGEIYSVEFRERQ